MKNITLCISRMKTKTHLIMHVKTHVKMSLNMCQTENETACKNARETHVQMHIQTDQSEPAFDDLTRKCPLSKEGKEDNLRVKNLFQKTENGDLIP